ncbi:MAG: efflux RND transporter periplasmic adaptor subunit [Thermoflexibacter sp.]|jgi:RND family efflux transporter MFP subunit|nr:efflux RND transporter periplasmic adaptor subunit [Thermoflexibacter sp.]
MKNIVLIYILTIIVCLSSCGGEEKAKENTSKTPDFLELSESQLATLNIKFGKPEKKQIVQNVYLNGKVKSLPNLSATVSSNIEGKVDRIFVVEGSIVKKGAPLMTLTSMPLIELQNEYLSAKSESDFATIELDRQKELVRNNVGALVDLQTAEAKYKATLSRVKSLGAKLELLGINANNLQDPKTAKVSNAVTITSPIDGYVIKLPVSVGVLASEQTVLAELVNVNELHAEIYVYDKEIDLVKDGQSVQIDFVNHSFKSVVGRVQSISRSIDPETKAIEVHVTFNPPDNALVLPGMSVRAIVLNKDEDVTAHAVPLAAVLQEEDNYYVFGTDSEIGSGKLRIKKYKVNLGDKDESFTEIVFPNEVPTNLSIAQNNVAALEMQRKQLIGGL